MEEKLLIEKCKKVLDQVISKMSSMTKREREHYWLTLSDFEKNILLVGFFGHYLTK